MGWTIPDSYFGRCKRFISSVNHPDWHQVPPTLLFNVYWEPFNRGKVGPGILLTTHLHQVQELKISTVIQSIPLYAPISTGRDLII
jgi:hypothetical protein